MYHSMFRYGLPVFPLLVASALAQQASKVVVANGKFVFAELASTGTLTCVGGQALRSWPMQCSPGSTRVQIWNYVGVQAFQDIQGSGADLFRGTNAVVMHCNLDGSYKGYCWGTFEWQVPEMGGKWEGVWSGPWEMLTNTMHYHMTGYGSGGQLEGLAMEFDAAASGASAPAVFVVKVIPR